MNDSGRSQVKCRPIEENDRVGVVDCLARGFPNRKRDYWTAALGRMARRPAVADYPKYGRLLECEGRIVGILLQIYFRRGEGEKSAIYCNLSSWCIDPPFRGYAAMLNSAATARKEVTYLNISPAPHTRAAIEALGFRRYCDGVYACIPALSLARRAMKYRILPFAPDSPEVALLSAYEREILAEHAALGCRSVIAATDEKAHPFVFVARKVFRRLIPCEQLIYCRDFDDFVVCAGALGRFFLARGGLLCLVDANGPPPGLFGRYLPGTGPKYFKGPATPRLGDLSFTELTILGP
jgi:hypothetical protein